MGRRRRELKKAQEKEQATMSRRKFLLGTAGIAGLAGLAALTATLWKPTITFEEAQQHPELRHRFVEQLYTQYQNLPYLESLTYSPTRGSTPEGHAGMAVTSYTMGDIGKRKKQTVVIYIGGFEDRCIENQNDFLSALVDHELEGHAKLFYEGSTEFTEDDFLISNSATEYRANITQDVLELYAYTNQLNNRTQRKISPLHEQNTLIHIWKLYSDLIHPIRDGSIANPQALERFRKRFFIPEFRHMAVSINGYNGPVLLPNNQMLTFFGPIDLPDYLRR